MFNKLLGLVGVIILALMLGACQPSTPVPESAQVPAPVDAGQDAADAADQADTGADNQAEDQAPAVDAQALFDANGCAECHGANREGLFAPPLLPDTLTADPSFYATTITNGRGRMPSFANALSPEEINALVEWLMTVSP